VLDLPLDPAKGLQRVLGLPLDPAKGRQRVLDLPLDPAKGLQRLLCVVPLPSWLASFSHFLYLLLYELWAVPPPRTEHIRVKLTLASKLLPLAPGSIRCQ
jgi:hypothetical protein